MIDSATLSTWLANFRFKTKERNFTLADNILLVMTADFYDYLAANV